MNIKFIEKYLIKNYSDLYRYSIQFGGSSHNADAGGGSGSGSGSGSGDVVVDQVLLEELWNIIDDGDLERFLQYCSTNAGGAGHVLQFYVHSDGPIIFQLFNPESLWEENGLMPRMEIMDNLLRLLTPEQRTQLFSLTWTDSNYPSMPPIAEIAAGEADPTTQLNLLQMIDNYKNHFELQQGIFVAGGGVSFYELYRVIKAMLNRLVKKEY